MPLSRTTVAVLRWVRRVRAFYHAQEAADALGLSVEDAGGAIHVLLACGLITGRDGGPLMAVTKRPTPPRQKGHGKGKPVVRQGPPPPETRRKTPREGRIPGHLHGGKA